MAFALPFNLNPSFRNVKSVGEQVCNVGYVTSVMVAGPFALAVGFSGMYVSTVTLNLLGAFVATKYAMWSSSNMMILGVGMLQGEFNGQSVGLASAQADYNRNMGGPIQGTQLVTVTP